MKTAATGARMGAVKRILIEQKTGRRYFVRELGENFNTSSGIVAAKDLKSAGIIRSSKGASFLCVEPTFADLWHSLQRGPQAIIQKDIGLILAKTGVNKNSVVVDAGGGSGALCLSLANVCKTVAVYENNPEHYDLVAKNIKMVGAGNIILKQEDIYQGIAEKNLDLITLDLPEPWKVVGHAAGALHAGGFLVVYLPNLTQVKMFIDAAKGTRIIVQETLELLERKWKIEDRIMRPEFEMLGHTGFLTFCRSR